MGRSHEAAVTLASALHYHQDGDMMHEAVLADVYASLLATEGRIGRTPEQVSDQFHGDAARLRDDLGLLAAQPVGESIGAVAARVRTLLEEFLVQAESLTEVAPHDSAAAAAMLADVEAAFDESEVAQQHLTGLLRDALSKQRAAARAAQRDVRWQVVAISLAALAGLVALTLILGGTIVRSLRSLAVAAQEVVAGNLQARAPAAGSCELAALGRTFNEMTDGLTEALRRLEQDAKRDGFRTALAEALEHVDEEEEVCRVVERALDELLPGTRGELLLADSSRAHLRRVAEAPGGAAGCPVESPFGCVAVRRGTATVFPSSEALNACPRLPEHPDGACSAVCVPVGFMGRSLGVLHTSCADGNPPAADTIPQLASLASQAGARIGTVRAFRRTQLQASTDALTGLLNRRALEERARELLATGESVAVVIADLDRFKLLNDRHGHEAGDRALRTFARILRESVRADDVVARMGGEEFALLLPGLTAREAIDRLESLRATLAETVSGGDGPRFTASFGVSDSDAGRSLDDLLRIADAGLYAAKEGGRDQIQLGRGTGFRPADDRHDGNGSNGLARALVADDVDPRPSGREIR